MGGGGEPERGRKPMATCSMKLPSVLEAGVQLGIELRQQGREARNATGDKAASLNDEDVVTPIDDFPRVMAHINGSHAQPIDPIPKPTEQSSPDWVVETGQRFVQQPEPGGRENGSSQGHPLSFTPGQSCQRTVNQIG